MLRIEYREQNDRHAASLARESTRLRIARLDRDNRKAEDRTREKPGGS